jgi:hypothetical protein
MIIINTVNSTRFSLNGIQYFKNYISEVAGNSITVYNAYDRKDVKVDFINFAEIELNGTVYGNVSDLQSALLPVIYTRASLGGGGGSTPSLAQVLAVGDRDVDVLTADYEIVPTDRSMHWITDSNNLSENIEIEITNDSFYIEKDYSVYLFTNTTDFDVTFVNNSDYINVGMTNFTIAKGHTAHVYVIQPLGQFWINYLTDGLGGSSGGSSWIVISANKTAVNDEQYSNVANATYTDPSPVEGKGYEIKVVNGTATIGGVGFTEGMIVTRTFHSGSWRTKSYVDQTIIGTATQTALDEKADLNQVGNLIREDFTFGLSQTFTLANNYGQVYSVEVQGQGALSTSQYTLVAPNQVTINDTLNAGDYVVIIYSNAINGVQPYYSQAETDALVNNVAILKSVGATYTTNAILTVTQAEYDALTPNASTLYFII